ncbi:MAG: hypothetical protein ABR535_03845 [Pyrinomonadaceae bacterium]
MKYCPTCQTRYDEEILRFCMKDGTPLVEEKEPNFVQLPSEETDGGVDDDDASDVTIVRRNIPLPQSAEHVDIYEPRPRLPSERIVVPTYEEQREQRPRSGTYRQPLPPGRSTAAVVALTILGTLAVLAAAAAGIWLLQRGDEANTNIDVNTSAPNVNTNLNTNLGFDSNFNFNLNSNANLSTNVNINANIRTPTPTITPRPSPSSSLTSPSPTPSRSASPAPSRTPTPLRTPIPTPLPTIITPGSPRPASTPSRNLNGAVLKRSAVGLPKPFYPAMAKQIGVWGRVRVQVSGDANSARVQRPRPASSRGRIRGSSIKNARPGSERLWRAGI